MDPSDPIVQIVAFAKSFQEALVNTSLVPSGDQSAARSYVQGVPGLTGVGFVPSA